MRGCKNPPMTDGSVSNAAPRPRRRPRLLLINPRSPESFWSFRWALQELLPAKRAINPPLGLATVAALTPAHWQITILDENIESLPDAPQADVVGICGMAVQYARQRALLEHYRSSGHYVVAGGSFASLQPESYADCADTIIAGEAERIWPEFCRDFEASQAKGLYIEHGEVSLEESPTPAFGLLKLDLYTTASVQFSRGCPYQCEFCDIPLLFGRRPRTKTLQQVECELDALHRAGASNVFFVDDNLVGHQPRARALLSRLGDYQRRHGYPFCLGTEASVNLAANPELLKQFRNAGFRWVFLGIETPDTNSLSEAGKKQNLKGDLLEAVRNFYRNGIDVFSGFIVGFDCDTVLSFTRLFQFIVKSGIQVAMLGLLTAVPRTPLYRRLESAGRLRHDVPPGDNTGGKTNIVPLGMTYSEMTAGYTHLYRRLCSNRVIAARVRHKLHYFRSIHVGRQHVSRDSLVLGVRLLLRGILRGGIGRTAAFLWSLAGFRPSLWPVALHDWAHALSIRAYALRHLGLAEAAEHDRLCHRVQKLAERLRVRLSPDSLELRTELSAKRMCLHIIVGGSFATKEADVAARLLRRFLNSAPAVSIAVQLREASVHSRACVAAFLEPLQRHADRIVVRADRSLLPWLDSSLFRIATASEQ